MPRRVLQSFVVSGHKADFGTIALDGDPLKIDRVHQALLSSAIGPALEAVYSFVSLTEISEYVPSVEQYAERLKATGEDPNSPGFAAKVAAYEKAIADDERTAHRPRTAQLAFPLLLSHEQEPRRGGKLVYDSVLASQCHDGRACSKRNELCGTRQPSRYCFGGLG